MTTEQELYDYLKNLLQPTYWKKYNIRPQKNVMNLSQLVSGARSYLYHLNCDRQRPPSEKLSVALLRGSAIHDYISRKLEDEDIHMLNYVLPFRWKDGTSGIKIVAHYDNTAPGFRSNILIEFKTTGQDDIYKNGLVIRAKRQLASYANMLSKAAGQTYECFLVVFNSEMTIIKLTEEEIKEGWLYVRRTAYEVAKELDKEALKVLDQ